MVGDKDVEAGTVGLRRYGEEREKRGIPLAQVLAQLVLEAQPPGATPDSPAPAQHL